MHAIVQPRLALALVAPALGAVAESGRCAVPARRVVGCELQRISDMLRLWEGGNVRAERPVQPAVNGDEVAKRVGGHAHTPRRRIGRLEREWPLLHRLPGSTHALGAPDSGL